MDNIERGDWTQTYLGLQFFPQHPLPEDINIIDIAHGLSNICRFGGHVKKFYSVSQHCVLVSTICSPENALWGLLHDASEAYICDIPRPLKQMEEFKQYKLMEKKIQETICFRFDISKEEPADVKRADNILLATERRDLMNPVVSKAEWSFLPAPMKETIIPWSPEEAKSKFLDRFYTLKG